MSILTGLMIGSLITLWPWKESYDKGSLPENLPLGQILDDFDFLSIFITVLAFLIGIFSSYGLKYFERRLRN
jgi:uncharacterized membrane protein